MALFGILFLTLWFTFCFVSSEATMSAKEATKCRSERYTVLVVINNSSQPQNPSGTKYLLSITLLMFIQICCTLPFAFSFLIMIRIDLDQKGLVTRVGLYI